MEEVRTALQTDRFTELRNLIMSQNDGKYPEIVNNDDSAGKKEKVQHGKRTAEQKS